MTLDDPRYALLVPAYNEAGTIAALLEKLLEYPAAEIIVVDDGSSDETLSIAKQYPVTVLHNEQNLGKGGSLWRGFQHAIAKGYEAVITLDGDGQHDPRFIPELVAASAQHPETLIIGARLINRQSQPLPRYLANKFADFWVSWAAGMRVNDSQSGFRLYPLSLLKTLPASMAHSEGFVFESEAVIAAGRGGLDCLSVPIESFYSKAFRQSHFRPLKDIMLITRMVAGNLWAQKMNLPGLWRVITGSR